MAPRSLDRRRLIRASIDMAVEEERAAGRTAKRAVDICELGMRYVQPTTCASLDAVREVLLDFHLPGDARPIRALGFVTDDRVEGGLHSTSVTFGFLPDRDALRIRRFVLGKAA
jgi:hypothetical protein